MNTTKRLDARAVLFGRPMVEFVASRCWAMSLIKDPPAASLEAAAELRLRKYKDIHASWLMTTREDLDNQRVRDVLLADREALDEDMATRCEQWAQMGSPAPTLDPNTDAYLFGGFGTHELVMYYELIRHLLKVCFDRLPVTAAATSLEPYLETEVPWLLQARDEWLQTPDPEMHLRTPLILITNERLRLPEALFGKDAMIDPDCPCCQMLAELPGPTFMHLDGSNMDEEFEFDLSSRTREEWEAAVRLNTLSQGFLIQEAGDPATPAASVWARSFSMAENTELPIGVRLLGIAWHIAELVMELNEQPTTGQLVEQLNVGFQELRKLLTEVSLEESAEVDITPAITKLEHALSAIGCQCPELEPRCGDLMRKIWSLGESATPAAQN